MAECKVKKTMGYYILGKTIGEGTFGKVRLGTHVLTGEKVAVKVLDKHRITDVSDAERVSREIHILKIIRHPNLIQLYEIIETTKQLCLIMEYASGGELYDYIVANSRIAETEACRIFQQIISGLEYLHKLKVVHRDLKPENLLFDTSNNIKLVDFGLSNTYKQGEKLKTACGSPCYAAPEMVAGKKYNALQVDIWSAGVVLFTLLCGYLPFEDPDTSKLYKKILNSDYKLPKFISDKAKGMLEGLLNTDPIKRFTVDKIRNHPWFSIAQLKTSSGIVVGTQQIPVDPLILKQLEQFGFEPKHTQKCIEANKHDAATTTYYLLLQKYIRQGGKSVADISSPEFEPVNIGSQKIISHKSSVSDTPLIGTAPRFTEKNMHTGGRKYVDMIVNRKMEGTGGSLEMPQESEMLNNTVIIPSPKVNLNVKKKNNEVLSNKFKEYIMRIPYKYDTIHYINERVNLNVTEPLRTNKNSRRNSNEKYKFNCGMKVTPMLSNKIYLTGSKTTKVSGQKQFKHYTPKGIWNNSTIHRAYMPKKQRERDTKPRSKTMK